MRKHKFGWRNKACLYCSEELWEEVRDIIPPDTSVNDFLVYLLAREVDDVRRGKRGDWRASYYYQYPPEYD